MSRGEGSTRLSKLDGQQQQVPSKHRWSFKKRMLVTFVVLLAIIVPVFAFLAWEYSVCPQVTIVPAGSVLSVPSGQHLNYKFTVSKVIWGPNVPVTAALTSDNQVILYIMNATQFASFNSTNSASSYVWTSGQVSSVNYEQSCLRGVCPPNQPGAPLGTDYFIIYNPSSTVISKVTVSQPVLLQSC